MKDTLKAYAAEVEQYLSTCLHGGKIPEELLGAMDYSLLAGGKRLRPVLCVVWAELFGLAKEKAVPFASGLECIHTYSLIHDDLPALDDDDLRRGRPSNHKKFGEATAILAGDGLLTEAFVQMLKADLPAENIVAAAKYIAVSAGAEGMVGGQVLDMDYTGKSDVPLPDLRAMHAMKTGALITASCVSGALLAGAGEEGVAHAETYGKNVGVAFQIVDDILDVIGDEAALGKPVGSDESMGKTTYPGLVGLGESKRLAQEAADQALSALTTYDAPQAKFLRDLATYIVERAH